MTTIYEPLQRDDGRWDMTRRTGSTGPSPLGYCAGWQEENLLKSKHITAGFRERLLRDLEARRRFQEKYHTDGHASADEAHRCWLRFLVDQRLEWRANDDVRRRCAHCGEFTGEYASFPGECLMPVWVCAEHKDPDVVYAHLAKRIE